jgi:predicted enzyme related to lactoylglutathione lyase
MTNALGLRGLSTVNFYANDVAAAAKWYSELLGVAPYFANPNFEQPAYLEFRIGDSQHELGIVNSTYKPKGSLAGSGGAIVYWHVDDLNATLEKLLANGATEHAPVTTHGDGFVTASVLDPFGNILGVMFNQHYLDMLASISDR